MQGSSILRRESRALLELVAVCGFAIAQPVLSVYGRSADTFIFLDLKNRQIVLFAVDRLVGELMDRLRAEKLPDNSVVVLTADHGITFAPGQASRGLDASAVPASSYPQLLWAAPFVKASGQAQGLVSDANVMTIDILPTIAKLTGFTIPWKVDGVPAGTRTSTTKVFLESTTNAFGVGIGIPIDYDSVAGEKAMPAPRRIRHDVARGPFRRGRQPCRGLRARFRGRPACPSFDRGPGRRSTGRGTEGAPAPARRFVRSPCVLHAYRPLGVLRVGRYDALVSGRDR